MSNTNLWIDKSLKLCYKIKLRVWQGVAISISIYISHIRLILHDRLVKHSI